MLTIEKAVPAIDPTTPRIRIAMSFATVKGHGNPRNGGLSAQKVSISIVGGKMKARAQLATAPMRLIRPSRSGRPNARPAGKEEVCRGVLISDGGMYRLQWSWDLKMCPY